MINEQLSIKLDNVEFDGPLDLLIHLIYKNELNIFDLPIAEVTNYFIEEIKNMRSMDIEVAAEFISMASFLVYLKSRMLLPGSSSDEDEMDPEEAKIKFNQMLIEFSFYKDMAMEFRKFESQSGRFLSRYESLVILKEEMLTEDSFKLAECYFAPPKAKREKTMVIKNTKIRTEEVANFIKKYILAKDKTMWSEIDSECIEKIEKAVAFGVVLELIKSKAITAFQEENFAAILLTVIKELSTKDER